MQKTIQITVPTERTDDLLRMLQAQEGLLNLRVDRGSSLHPRGDSVAAILTADAMSRVLGELQERRIGVDSGTSIFTSELASAISPTVRDSLGTEPSDLGWEEIELEMAKQSNMTANALLLMAIAGAIAAAGLATNTLHLVVGAMIIAPGFEPITRISLGLVTGSEAWKDGLRNVAKGYTSLVGGAVVGSLLLLGSGTSLGGESTYLPPGELVEYWTTIDIPAVLVSALAGAAGAVLIASDRSVLTAGVLISLALIPSATLVGMGVVGLDLQVAGRAGLRWLVDVALVAVMAIPVFVWHARRIQRRTSII